MRTRLPLLAVVSFGALFLAACGGNNTKNDGPPSGSNRAPDIPDDAVPRPEARSRYGNGPVYEVLGKRYTVMPSANGYQESGVASWYGKKFHGNLTSNREVYDMYGMTAAHKTLPLPTYVSVRNLSNNKTIIVRVNDRGPFVSNRIIDLSYSAAMKIDMIQDGTALVEVTAINFDAPAGDRPTSASSSRAPTPTEPFDSGANLYVQVGAFGDRANAQRRMDDLASAGIGGASIHKEDNADRVLYRVRIGPVSGVVQYDVIVDDLADMGIHDPYLISE